MDVTEEGRFLCALNPASGTVNGFLINGDGSLTPVANGMTGVPMAAQGPQPSSCQAFSMAAGDLGPGWLGSLRQVGSNIWRSLSQTRRQVALAAAAGLPCPWAFRP